MGFSLRFIFFLGASILTWTPTSARPRASEGVVKRELVSYEERYINSRSYKHPNTTVKLVGCKKMKIPASEVSSFEDHYYANYDELKKFESHFYDEANREIRIYFPVENALVEHEGKMIEANELGEFDLDSVDGDYAVLGRYQTDHVRGVDGNIIKDGVIYLAEKVYPHRQLERVFVYDFGYKDLHDHDHDHDHNLHKRCENLLCPSKGCVKNHGGQNCSNRFGIKHGRCPFKSDTCMDYNGPNSSCKKADRLKYFIGSDCASAVAQGHCYNEMLAAASGD
ncbi:hypothetical protein B0T18DRAFT_441372 [Schizothecium vesticola]|uniref:Uncharacterized protein n=1 Tax=Schizothecium vesticola TaxID=314040 RepID=A0AA40BR85_9PEZI|nr:hypothetical protein B0T18DRAFT_441372 [Schizothecium vesticola]